MEKEIDQYKRLNSPLIASVASLSLAIADEFTISKGPAIGGHPGVTCNEGKTEERVTGFLFQLQIL